MCPPLALDVRFGCVCEKEYSLYARDNDKKYGWPLIQVDDWYKISLHESRFIRLLLVNQRSYNIYMCRAYNYRYHIEYCGHDV